MTVENDQNRPRHLSREKIATRTGGYGWMALAIGTALIFGIILMLPNSDGTAPRVTATTPRIDRPNVTPEPAAAPPADTQVPTAPPSAPTPPQ